MNRHRLSLATFVILQVVIVSAMAAAFFGLSDRGEVQFRKAVLGQEIYPLVAVERETPLSISPFYDDPSVVSDEDLARVLLKIRPLFPEKGNKPNYVEHALRAWGVSATFTDPRVMSGEQMRDFLLDHSRYAASWSDEPHDVPPLLIDRPRGVAVRWGMRQETSVHHDHLLACLTEAGLPIHQRVYAPSGRYLTLNEVLQESLRDFRPDERETEWSALAYALWLPPTKSWQTQEGRTVTFDMLADRLMRGHKEIGVCAGTHRVYSLMLLWRLDQDYDIITEETAERIYEHLKDVRDVIAESQFPDGHWPANWADGRSAVENPRPGEPQTNVIATGHHLEWLAIAPEELHPPREMIRKAAKWLIEETTSKTEAQLYEHYTFYSHVGNALALWRKTHPAEFWKTWTLEHPDYERPPANPLAPPPIENPTAPPPIPTPEPM